MNQVIIIAIAVLLGALLAGAAVLKGMLIAVMRLHFGIERGRRDREAWRRYRAFEWCCWKTYGCVSAILSLQDLRGLPFSMLADLSGVVIPIQVCFTIAATILAVSAISRFRDPYAY